MGDPPPTLPNPRLAELRQALAQARPVAVRLPDDLQVALSAMRGGAWVSTAADAFYAELTSQRSTVQTAGDGCVHNLEQAIAGCPATIPNPAAKQPARV